MIAHIHTSSAKSKEPLERGSNGLDEVGSNLECTGTTDGDGYV